MARWRRINGAGQSRNEKREKREGTNLFKELMKIIKHFFPNLIEVLGRVNDPRNQSYIYYDVTLMLLMRIFAGTMGIESMRRITVKFDKNECIENFQRILNDKTIDELPHYDTINDFLSKLDPEELKKVCYKLICHLIRKKCFYKFRLKNKWLVSVDGTKMYMFNERHCDHCLTKTHNKGKENEYTQYFHYVLEAKLTIGDMVFSIASEFIENPENLEDKKSEDAEDREFTEKKKQDCELKAWYRMAEKLKSSFPCLPICFLFDSLYANQEVMELCEKNGWEYIIRFKEGSLPTVAKEFESLIRMDGELTRVETKNISNTYQYINEIDYEGHKINIIESTETISGALNQPDKTTKFTFITSSGIKITKKNQAEIASVGRNRWKIENQGFNEQKNHGYELTHIFSHNYTAMKNHYTLIQIAHMIRQLFEVGVKILREFENSLKNFSFVALEDFRNKVLVSDDLEYINKRSQIRLDAAAT